MFALPTCPESVVVSSSPPAAPSQHHLSHVHAHVKGHVHAAAASSAAAAVAANHIHQQLQQYHHHTPLSGMSLASRQRPPTFPSAPRRRRSSANPNPSLANTHAALAQRSNALAISLPPPPLHHPSPTSPMHRSLTSGAAVVPATTTPTSSSSPNDFVDPSSSPLPTSATYTTTSSRPSSLAPTSPSSLTPPTQPPSGTTPQSGAESCASGTESASGPVRSVRGTAGAHSRRLDASGANLAASRRTAHTPGTAGTGPGLGVYGAATNPPRLVPVRGASPAMVHAAQRRRPPPRAGSINSDAGSTTDTERGAGAPNSAAVVLDQLPRAFVLQRLHELAPTFWSNPRTADVRLIVPMRENTPRPGESGPSTPKRTLPTPDPARHDMAPAQGAPGAPRVPAMSYALHRDYLAPQSALMRLVLFGRLPPDSPELKGCRVLPFGSLHGPRPLYVPLPDPESFGVLVHWMYWGDVSALENALSSGAVSWRGIVANIEYLGLDDRTKQAVGRWWRRWAKAEARSQQVGGYDEDADVESDDDGQDDADELYPSWRGAGMLVPADMSQHQPAKMESASAADREYDADEMAKRLGML